MTDINEQKSEELLEEKINPVEKYVEELKKDMGEQEVVRPDFLLPQFRSVEEQAKSYKELQGLQTKQAQELAEYKKLEEMQNAKTSSAKEISTLQKQAKVKEEKLKELFVKEMQNLGLALKSGKISQAEAKVCAKQLKTFIQEKMQAVGVNYKQGCEKCDKTFGMVSPKEYFHEDLKDKNYLASVSEFLEKNYKKMPKAELEGIKNLISVLETSLREEILNEKALADENVAYRQNLRSATNLNPQALVEKIYTLDEIKKMKPEEFRKNQKTILEQFASRKIK